VLLRMSISRLEMSLIHAMAKMAAWEVRNAIKNSVGSDNLLWFGNDDQGRCGHRGGPMMDSNMMMMVMMSVDMVMMRDEDFTLGNRGGLSDLCCGSATKWRVVRTRW